MRWRWLLPVWSILSGVAPTALAGPPPAKPEVLDGIVAVMDLTPVLLSELRSRAKPALIQLGASGPETGPERAAAETQLYREVLSRMIDDLLFTAAAERARLVVTVDEIDAALRTIATTQGVTPTELLAAAKAAGFPRKEYREEIRRQILQARVVRLRIMPRIKGYDSLPEPAREQRLREEQTRWLGEQRAAHFIELRL
jgi:peptidyl-prolyl cis-trans isomerase SurA